MWTAVPSGRSVRPRTGVPLWANVPLTQAFGSLGKLMLQPPPNSGKLSLAAQTEWTFCRSLA